jgi:BMFP domain-containing protein YqiC
MTQTSNRILDEFARLVTDASGVAQGIRREVETVVKAQLERLLRDMDVASREELEVLRDLASTAREENRRLTARLEALEARLDRLEGGPSDRPAPSAGATP